MEYEPNCILCRSGTLIRLTGHVLCRREGVTDPRFSCKYFELDYLKLQPKRPPIKRKKQFSPEDFSL